MSGKARVEASLDMNISGFRAGLDKANGFLETWKRNLKAGDVGNGLKGLLGAGVFIEGFRSALEHARELRKEAQETGRTLDKWTTAAARFSDVLLGAKSTGSGLLTKGVGALNLGGEKVGDFAVWLTNKLGLNSAGEYDTARGEAAQNGAESAEAGLARARKNVPEGFMRDHNRQMRGLDMQESLIGATEPAQLAAMRQQVKELRAEAEKLTRPEDFTERKKLEMEARRIEVEAAKKTSDLADQKRKNEEKRWDFMRENTPKEETSAEKIARLNAEADRERERALDTTRDLSEREEHRMKMLEKSAQAEKLEYEWKNKPLTVAEAAANTASGRRNTNGVGVAARRINRYEELANRARAEGRYGAAEHYDSLARDATDDFQKRDRAAREAARGAGAPAPGSWDAKYGGQMAARQARIAAHYGGAFDRPDSLEQAAAAKAGAGDDLKGAAQALNGAAEALKNAVITIDVEDSPD